MRILISAGEASGEMYGAELRQRYGKYFFLGRKFAGWIGNPTIMRNATRYGLPRRAIMGFALRLLGNLTDGRSGDAQDRLIHMLTSLAPAS